MVWNYKPEKHEWIKENQGKHFCQCGCGEPIIILPAHYKPSQGIPRFIQGHQSRGKLNHFYKGADEWVKERQGQYFCKCGCTQPINITIAHRWKGIPIYLCGHVSKADPTKNPMFGKTREKNPAWRGGRKKRQDGYIVILMPEHSAADPNGYVFEHRIVMEKQLGRFLTSEEVVHHINGIKDDNRIENLMLCKDHAEHRKVHLEQN